MNKLFISLGCNCYVSWTLRKIGFQNISYPLDWVNSFFFMKTLQFLKAKDFKFINYLSHSPLTCDNDKYHVKFSEEYLFRMPHEFEKDENCTVQDIINRYSRRMERLKSDVAKADFVYYIRYVNWDGYFEMPPEEDGDYKRLIRQIISTLQIFSKHKRFCLLIMSGKHITFQTMQPIFPIGNIIPFENIFFNYSHSKIYGDDLADRYKFFFRTLSGLNPTDLSAYMLAEIYKLIFS